MASKSTARRYQNEKPAFGLPAGYDIRLTEDQIEFLIYHALPTYQQDTQREAAKLQALQDAVEMSSRAATEDELRVYDARQLMIEDLELQVEEAEELAAIIADQATD